MTLRLRTESVVKRYADVVAVDRATLTIEQGEIVALLGPSGAARRRSCGCSRASSRPDAGAVEIDGVAVAGAGTWVPPERRRVGMVFQDYALFPHLTVAENVGFGLPRGERSNAGGRCCSRSSTSRPRRSLPARALGRPAAARRARARARPRPVASCCSTSPGRTSTRSCAARCATRSPLLLRRLGVTVVLVTHDREEAFSLADRIALMRDGHDRPGPGRPEDLYYLAGCRWAAEFVGAGNVRRAARSWTASSRRPSGASRLGGDCGERADVLVRPELLELAPDPAGAGEVVGREFRGHDVFYRVRLDGLELVSQRPSNEVVPLGARVLIHVHEAPTPRSSTEAQEPST